MLALLVSCATPALARAQAADPPPVPELDPESPMANMPDIGVDWPDMNAELPAIPAEPAPPADAAAPAPPPAQTTEITGERRYRFELQGLDMAERAELIARFTAGSTLKAGDDKPANIAQIDRRAREDANLLNELLRAEGYYDANVETAVDSTSGATLVVKLIAEPGPLYRFSSVTVRGLESTGPKAAELRAAFSVDENDAVDADDVVLGQTDLTTLLKKEGFPFAKVGDPEVVVDHETQLATLTMDVEPGGQRNFGQILLSGNKLPFDAKHVSRIARFKPGDPYDQSKVDDLRRALIATGLVSQANVKPVPGASDMLADVSVGLEPRRSGRSRPKPVTAPVKASAPRSAGRTAT